MAETMRAMAATGDGCELAEIPKPTPGPGEVRVGVIAAAVNPAEARVMSGALVGRLLHAKTNPLVLGWDLAGTVDALGDGAADIEEGTAVWGHLAYAQSTTQGTFSEYVTLPRDSVAVKPDEVPHHVAAAAATVSMTSLQSLRDLGRLREGGRALIVGAGGGVGSVAVGVAKRLGAHVTGVCSPRDAERVTALGADVVVDRTKTDPLDVVSAYDVVFDTPAVHSFGKSAKALRAGGAYVTTLPDAALIAGMVRALFTSKRCRFVKVRSQRADLELVGEWLAEGLQVPIDSRHAIADLANALSRQLESDRAGRVVVDVAGGWQ